MNWTESDIQIAKQLVEPSTLAFIRKVFCTIKTQNGKVLKGNIASLDDAQYGRLMKIIYLSEQENSAKISLIQKIAKTKPKKEGEKKTLAPK